ncbi:hypothetical protein [Marinobacter persicus]|uniref:Uncharacterized protein n=1 Tax=Marinobacter persicus TaxID=930118 RepID=A0A2S6G335_9GAMM|nr:hypothetical protein [Marinobacter persicus]KXS54391.1 MAG: hypothetical protein AWU57_1224 [Marinobacter sp. T13-3]PPK50230.1 hypothetical protein BY455_1301 [Marinobacter persicus]PPK52855.1 hypothetical protein B0H24_10311 [Marinobacter persicus]PPK56718.1 hypothetical protein BY454_1331 [Marinobacter persicus]
MTTEPLVVIKEDPKAWAPQITELKKRCAAVVKDRKNLPHSAVKEIMLDRDRRFYWAILVYKAGRYNYHVRHEIYKEMYGACLRSLTEGVKEGWDAYVEEITKRDVPRETILKALPKYEDIELGVEEWIATAEFIRSVMVDGGCSPVMFDIEPLEMLSGMIDEGCVDASEPLKMRIVKRPSFTGWERYFGPGVTRVNMQ